MLDQKLIDSLVKKKILYIPIALERDAIGFESAYAWFISAMSTHSHDFIDITMWLDLNNKTINDLLQFEVIYIGGGNTYKLLKELHFSGFDLLMPEFLRQGGIIYGGSAGAIILGDSVSTVKEENTINYIREDGLSILSGLSVFCHYKPEEKAAAMNFVQARGKPVICLTERSGAVINGTILEAVGYDALLLLQKDDSAVVIRPGERFELA